MAEVEDQDVGTPPPAAPIYRSGLDASMVGSRSGQVGDLVEGISMLCGETLVDSPLAVDDASLETAICWVGLC